MINSQGHGKTSQMQARKYTGAAFRLGIWHAPGMASGYSPDARTEGCM